MRYSTFKYGGGSAGAKYGTSPATTNLLWSFLVAWDGSFDGSNEVTRAIDFYCSRGRQNLLQGSGFEHYAPGTAQITLDNSDHRYDPWNTSSPLYPNVSPGKFVRIAVKEGNTGTNYGIMRGTITDIQAYRKDNTDCVQITIEDGLRFLANQIVRLGMTTGTQLDNLARLILDEAGWNSVEWPHPSNTTTKGLTWYWSWDDDSALAALNGLADLGLGVFFHDRNGMARFAGGNESFTTAYIDVDESELLRDISISQPWEQIRNEIIVVNYLKKQYANTDVLWEIEFAQRIAIPAGATQIFDAKFKNETNALHTAAYGLTTADFSFYLAGDYGDPPAGFRNYILNIEKYATGVQFSFTNPAVAESWLYGTITPSTDVYDVDKYNITVKDEASQLAYGKKTFILDNYFIQNHVYAGEAAAFLLDRFKDPTPHLKVSVDARPELQFTPDLYRYTFNLTMPTYGIDDQYRIGGIKHNWLQANGQAVRTIFWLEPRAELFSYTS